MVTDMQLITNYTMRHGNNWGVGVLILNNKNQALVGLRTDTKDWCTPGGKVEVGETVLKGILRETKEEVNLKLRNPELVDVIVKPFRNNKVWVTFMFLATEYSGKEKPQLSELSELNWVNLEELKHMNLFEPTRVMLDIFELNKVI
jgi:mutator protein MutT